MFSSSISTSNSVRSQGGNGGGWLGSLSTTDTASNPGQRKRPLREKTLPPPSTNPKEGSLNETDSIGATPVPQPVAAVASRLGVLGWFGSSSSINSGVGERPVGDESKTQVEEITVERSEPECPVPDREEALLERERQVESREKELEERKVAIDQRERELEDRCRGLEDRERVWKEGEEEMQRKMEEVERKERELEERRGEFEKEKEKWLEERNKMTLPDPDSAPEWRNAMEALKKEMNLELLAQCKKAEERELALETRVMKRVTEILAQDRDEQNAKASGWKRRWDTSIKPLTRKATSSTASDFGI